MRQKLIFLLTAGACLLVMAGCVSLPAERPAATPSLVMTEAPTAAPEAAVTATVVPTEAAPLETTLPEATPTETEPTAAPRSQPTDSAFALHPPGTRSGIAAVDRAIDAILSGDDQAVLNLLQMITTPCTTADGLGGPPKCAMGEAEGTPVEVFPLGGPEGSFMRRDELGRLQLDMKGLYAVYQVPPGAYQQDYWPAGDYGVLFLDANGWVVNVLVNAEGIVRLDSVPANTPEQVAPLLEGTTVLAPADR